MLPKEIQNYLLKYFKLEKADSQKKEELLRNIDNLFNEIIINSILSNLDDTDAKMFFQLLEEDKTGSKVIDFAKQKITNLDTKLKEIIFQEIKNLNI